MARYAGGGKNTVEGCRSIDVLRWHKLDYLRSPRLFSWVWTRDGEREASINVETQYHSVTLKYRSSSYGEDWSDVEQRIAIAWTPCRFGGERPWFVCSVRSNGVYCGRRVTKLYSAGRLFACRNCYRLTYASQQESVLHRGAPTWLLLESDWASTKQAAPFMSSCSNIVAIGRVKWIEGSRFTGKDNHAWYRFDSRHRAGPPFHWRDQVEVRRARVCEQCRKPFEPQRSTARFCSETCRQRAYRNKVSVTPAHRPAKSFVMSNTTMCTGSSRKAGR